MNKKFLWISLVVVFLSAPAFGIEFSISDAKVKVGGTINLDAGWDFSFHGDVPPYIKDKQTQMFLEMPDDTNLNMQINYKDLGVYTEVRYGTYTDVVNMYALYGTYQLSANNSILFGKSTTVFASAAPTQYMYNDNNLGGYGNLDPWRNTIQICFSHTGDKLSYDIALEKVKTDSNIIDNAPGSVTSVGGNYQVNNILPGLAADIAWKPNDKLSITPSLYIQQYRLKPKADGATYAGVTTYGLACAAEYKLKKVNLSGELWYGQNLSVLGIDERPDFFSPVNISGSDNYLTLMGEPVWDNGKLKNAESFGLWAQAEVPMEKFTPRIGVGYQNSAIRDSIASYDKSIHAWGIFANCDYTITKGLMVSPEILYMNNGKDFNQNFLGTGYNKLGYETIIGVHAQYDF